MKTDDDKLVMFRQQTAIVGNKKENLVEKLQEIRGELTAAIDEVQDKKAAIANMSRETMVKEEDFKEYVKSLRVKSTRYKQMKAELAYLKTEAGVLGKTSFILEDEVKHSMDELVSTSNSISPIIILDALTNFCTEPAGIPAWNPRLHGNERKPRTHFITKGRTGREKVSEFE